MSRSWLVLFAVSCQGCDSPRVVSFNTPELCVPSSEGLETFNRALVECGDDCVLCVESESDGRAASYSVSHDDNCVCRPPRRSSLPDAGSQTEESSTPAAPDSGVRQRIDGGHTTSVDDGGHSGVGESRDSGARDDTSPGGAGCLSRLHLTKAQARTQCSDWEDCHVCVERVDFDGDARSYMAHQCGCPDAYRVDPD